MNESTREIDPTIGPTNPNAELPSRRGTRPDARNSLVIFCLTLALYLLSSSGRPRVMDEHMVFFQTQSLSERGTLAVSQARDLGTWYGKEGSDGLPYGPYGPAHPLILVPAFKMGTFVTKAFDVPAEGAVFVWGVAVVSFHALLGALAIVLFHGLLGRLGASPHAALWMSLGVAFSTPLWPYSGTLFSEIWTALLLLAAASAVEYGTRAGAIHLGSLALAGMLLGTTILTRPVHVVATLLFGLALLFAPVSWGRKWRGALSLGAAGAVGLSIYLGYNYLTFADPLDFGYPSQSDAGTDVLAFNQSLAVGILGFLLSPGKSLFLFAPLTLAAMAGLPVLWRRHRPLAIIALAPLLSYLLFYAGYRHWEGGYCYGPRYLVPVIPLALLGLAPLLENGQTKVKVLIICLTVAGLAVQIPGVFTSFLEEQVGSGSYYDAQFHYQMGHNAITGQMSLLLEHGLEALRGNPLSGSMGTGLDLWFLFLRKAGISWKFLTTFLLVPCLLLVAALFLFLRIDLLERKQT